MEEHRVGEASGASGVDDGGGVVAAIGGAGAVEAIATVLALKNGIIPPTINHFDDDPQIDPRLDIVFNQARQRDIHYGLSNSFGFGGQNATVIFKKFE